MKKNWEVKKIEDVCDVIGGGTPSKANAKFYNGNIPWATVRDMNCEVIEVTENKITEEAVKCSSTNIIPKGNVIIATRVGLGKVCLLKNNTAINQDLRGIVPKNPCMLSVKYLFHWFKSISHIIEKEGTGATVKGVKLPFIKSLTLPLPPLPEQQSIAFILDESFAAIAKAKENTEKNLQNARELFGSYLQSVFANPGDDWEEKRLGEIAVVQSGGTPLRSQKEYWNGGNTAWYSSGELNNLYTATPGRYINDMGLHNSNAKLFPKGSLLIGMYDTAALKMSILDRDAAFNQAIAGVKPNSKIDLFFLLHALIVIKPVVLNQRRGVRQKNLSLEKIKNISILMPEINVQRLIVSKLAEFSNETKKLEAIYQQKLDNLEELKKSLLQKAFNGEL